MSTHEKKPMEFCPGESTVSVGPCVGELYTGDTHATTGRAVIGVAVPSKMRRIGVTCKYALCTERRQMIDVSGKQPKGIFDNAWRLGYHDKYGYHDVSRKFTT